MTELTEREMGACLIAYIEFSVDVAYAMQGYGKTKDVDAMIKEITSAVEKLEEQVKGFL